MSKTLTLEGLKAAVGGRAAAIRCRSRLQPAGGEGTKVFPPTHSGGVYAAEQRRLPGREQPVDCVLLDSVQSQANRVEEALQQAVDEGLIELPTIVVEFGEQVADVQRVTSLQAPHRAADAILRDSELDGVPFRESEVGRRLTDSSLANATALFEYCPHALVLGIWDSTGPKGGLGAKFARALVSEIVGIDAVRGVKTASRIDPLQTRAAAKVIKSKNGWVMADEKAKGAVSPAEINHGNIPPDIDDKSGGVTIAYAEHTAVLSLPQLRRLRFPLNGQADPAVNEAARTVLASLALLGLVLSIERGCDLRSRCLLFPEGGGAFEILDKPGQPTQVELNGDAAVDLFKQAVAGAKAAGLPWRAEPIVLKPAAQLIELVKRSQTLAAADATEGAE